MDELRPCPFCGGENVSISGPYGWYRQFCITHSCPTFYSGAQELAQGFPSKAEAVAAWNTRAAMPIARDDGKLREADELYELVRSLWHYARKGTPDANLFDRSERGVFLRRSVEKIAALASTVKEGRKGVMAIERDGAFIKYGPDDFVPGHSPFCSNQLGDPAECGCIPITPPQPNPSSNTQGVGVPPSGSGSRPSDGAASVSTVPASIPNAGELGVPVFPRLPDAPTFKSKPWRLSERALAQIAEIERHTNWPFRRF